MNNENDYMTYEVALDAAADKSRADDCTVHVCAVLRMPTSGREPSIAGYRLSDWLDGTTVVTYTSGRRHD